MKLRDPPLWDILPNLHRALNVQASTLRLRLVIASQSLAMAAVSFMTGSSWGVFVLVMPIVATLTQSLGADPALVSGATISASTFGSHACFYSDATVLTAKATGCTPLQHALTQFPYALLAAGLAVVGYLLLAFL